MKCGVLLGLWCGLLLQVLVQATKKFGTRDDMKLRKRFNLNPDARNVDVARVYHKYAEKSGRSKKAARTPSSSTDSGYSESSEEEEKRRSRKKNLVYTRRAYSRSTSRSRSREKKRSSRRRKGKSKSHKKRSHRKDEGSLYSSSYESCTESGSSGSSTTYPTSYTTSYSTDDTTEESSRSRSRSRHSKHCHCGSCHGSGKHRRSRSGKHRHSRHHRSRHHRHGRSSRRRSSYDISGSPSTRSSSGSGEYYYDDSDYKYQRYWQRRGSGNDGKDKGSGRRRQTAVFQSAANQRTVLPSHLVDREVRSRRKDK